MKPAYVLVTFLVLETLISCNECAKLIAQSGIKEIIIMSNKHKDLDAFKATSIIFKHAKIKMRLYESTKNKLIIDFNKIKK
jgi:dCMP deaminase